MATTQRAFTYRNRYFFLTDFVLIIASALVSFVLRLETVAVNEFAIGLLWFTALSLIVKLSIFVSSGIYRRYWKSAGPAELILLGRTCLVAGIVMFGLVLVLTLVVPSNQIPLLPRSVAIIDFLLSTLLVITARFSLRASNHWQNHRHNNSNGTATAKRAVIIGAGQTGIQVFDTLGTALTPINVVGFLDDDLNKVGTYVRGLKVLGQIADLPELA